MANLFGKRRRVGGASRFSGANNGRRSRTESDGWANRYHPNSLAKYAVIRDGEKARIVEDGYSWRDAVGKSESDKMSYRTSGEGRFQRESSRQAQNKISSTAARCLAAAERAKRAESRWTLVPSSSGSSSSSSKKRDSKPVEKASSKVLTITEAGAVKRKKPIRISGTVKKCLAAVERAKQAEIRWALASSASPSSGASTKCATRSSNECAAPRLPVFRKTAVQRIIQSEEFIPQNSASYPRILSVAEDAKLVLPVRGRHAYELVNDGGEGIPSHFSDDDYEAEYTLGIDFGTSAAKVVLHDGETDDCIAIPFVKARGIDAYLLPTRLYESSPGHYTLDPTKTRISSAIKLDLMKSPGSSFCLELAVAFVALLIRHARAWIYENVWNGEGDIFWLCRIGRPSNSADGANKKLWKKLLVRAWRVAEEPGPVTSDSVKAILDDCDPKELGAYFESVPEVQAEADGFLRNYPAQDGQQDFTLVDIGSGTVDVSAFCLSRSPTNGKTYVWNFGMSIQPLGTTNCHRARLAWLLAAFAVASKDGMISPERLEGFTSEINRELTYSLRDRLKDHWNENTEGITYSDSGCSVDDEFQYRVFKHVQAIRAGCFHSGKLDREAVKKMPVIFCGGGSRSHFYRESIERYNHTAKNASWLQLPRPVNSGKIRLELAVPIEDEDYDRLLVAYGLSTCIMGVPPDLEVMQVVTGSRKAFSAVNEAASGGVGGWDFSGNYADKDAV